MIPNMKRPIQCLRELAIIIDYVTGSELVTADIRQTYSRQAIQTGTLRVASLDRDIELYKAILQPVVVL